MPLVPTQLYSQWYLRSSWVYQNFRYLFQNELWTKNVPKGFSLCPYWWLALFALLILRPLIFFTLAVGRGIRSLRLGRAMECVDGFFHRLIVCRLAGAQGPVVPVLTTVLALLIIVLVGLIVGALGTAAFNCWQAGVLSAFVLPFTLLVTLIICGIYAESHRGNRCPVEVYVRAVAFLSVVAAFALHPDYAYSSFVQIPVDFVVGCGQLIAFLFTGAWHCIVIAAKWLVSGVWELRSLVFWLLVSLGLVGLYGYFGRPLAAPSFSKTDAAREREKRKREFADWLMLQDYTHDFAARAGDDRWYYRFVDRFTDWTFAILDKWDPSQEMTEDMKAKIQEAWLEDQAIERLWEERCQRTAAAVARLFVPVTWTFKQIGAFCSYACAMIKARKTLACPYLPFRD